jgi:hypothetical protein
MDIKNFAIITGKDTTIDKGRIKIISSKSETNYEEEIKNSPKKDLVNIRSDVSFINGSIELKFKTDSWETGVLIILKSSNSEGIAVGLSKTFDSFLISQDVNLLETNLKVGSFKNYKLNEEHKIKFELVGSYAKLYMNDVLMCQSILNVKESIIEFRLSTEGILEIFEIKATVIKPKVFVVMQFSKEYNELYEDVIKPITEKAGYECIRADEFYTSTPILKDIIESIQNSAVIIAEITPDNPNVFYEIGYSHAISKPTILLCDTKREKLPFDLSSFRTLFYENTIAGKKKVESNLVKYLENIK